MKTLAPGVVDHAIHTTYSDPGRFAGLVAAVSTDLDELSTVVRNVIEHYRASDHELPVETLTDIHARRVDQKLALDQERHATPLAAPREPEARVQGCCRDHTLLSVAILRQHDIPARSRIGFADYFVDGWHHDHVIPEVWSAGRWVRFDPELPGPTDALPDPRDIPVGIGFHPAAEVWRAHRIGELDVETYGVDPDVPGLHGAWFVRNYVVSEVAHRFGDELLLWDQWGTMNGLDTGEQDVGLIDEVAALLVAADAGDIDAERRLLDLYRADERLHPGDTVLRVDLPGDALVADRL